MPLLQPLAMSNVPWIACARLSKLPTHLQEAPVDRSIVLPTPARYLALRRRSSKPSRDVSSGGADTVRINRFSLHPPPLGEIIPSLDHLMFEYFGYFSYTYIRHGLK